MTTWSDRLALIITADTKGAVAGLEAVGTTANRELAKAQSALDVTGRNLTRFGVGAVATGAVVGAGLYKAVQAYEDAQQASLKLDNSIRNSPAVSASARKAFDAQADALHKVVAADDDAITGAQALLVQMGLTEQQVIRLIPLIIDLSRKTGKDLDTVAKAVGRSVNGSTGALGKMGITVDKTAASTDSFTATLDALNRTVAGFAKNEAATQLGAKLEILKNQMGDIAENVGKGASDAFINMADKAGGLGDAVTGTDAGMQEFAGSVGTYAATGLVAAGATSALIGQAITARKRFQEAAAAAKAYAAATDVATVSSAGGASALAALGGTAAVVLPLMAISYAHVKDEQAKLDEVAQSYADALAKQGDETRNLDANTRDLLTSNTAYGEQVAGMPADLKVFEAAVRSGGKAVDDLASTAQSGGGDMATFIESLRSGPATDLSRALLDLYDSGKLNDEQFAALVADLSRLSDGYAKGTTETNKQTAATEKNAKAQADAAAAIAKTDKLQNDALDSLFRMGEANTSYADAQTSASDAAVQAFEHVADAERQVTDAARSLNDAHRDTLDAVNALPGAYRSAEDALASLQQQQRDGDLSIREARLNLADAQDKLTQTLNDPNASDRDKERAQLGLERAQNNLTDAIQRQADTEQELNDRRQKGLDKSPEVLAAQDRITKAKQTEKDATDRLHDAEKARSDAAAEGAKSVQEANGKILDALRKQQEQVLLTIAAWRHLWWEMDPSKIPAWAQPFIESGDIPGATTPPPRSATGPKAPTGGRSAVGKNTVVNMNTYVTVDGATKTTHAAIEAGARRGTKQAILAYNRRAA